MLKSDLIATSSISPGNIKPGVNISTYFLHSVEGRVLNFHEYGEEFWQLLTKEADNYRFLHEISS